MDINIVERDHGNRPKYTIRKRVIFSCVKRFTNIVGKSTFIRHGKFTLAYTTWLGE